MDFGTLKRRTTDLVDSASKNMPAMPAMPAMNMPNVSMPKMQMPSLPKNFQLPNFQNFQLPDLSNLPSLPGFKSDGPAMKASWQHIDVPALARSSHSLNVIAGSAYVFGGETDSRRPVDNHMHVINLPVSGAPADYYSVAAKPSSRIQLAEAPATIPEEAGPTARSLTDVPLSPPVVQSPDKGKAPDNEVPAARYGHAAAVIGTRIFVFGGLSTAGELLDERGRVWVFETKTQTWTYLDPAADSHVPPARAHFAAVATEKPRDFAMQPLRRSESWREWAEGDSSDVGIPQRPIAGHVGALAADEEDAGYGTLVIHAGVAADGSRLNDLWAFDVRARIWKELPSAPGPARSGTALALSGSRLYRFGGSDGAAELGGQLDVLELGVDLFNDRVSKGEVGVFARGEWTSLAQFSSLDPAPSAAAAENPWPPARSAAGMHRMVGAGGREYLILLLGERAPAEGNEAAGAFFDDVWAFQIPAVSYTAASVTDAMFNAMGRRSGEGRWTRVALGPYDDEVEADVAGPGARGFFASSGAEDLEEAGIVILGGVDERNSKIGDGWLFRLDY